MGGPLLVYELQGEGLKGLTAGGVELRVNFKHFPQKGGVLHHERHYWSSP